MTIQYDITELKRAEREVRRLNSDLEQRQVALEAANQELEAFSYSVAHDLRAPLRHVAGYVGLLQEQAGAMLDDESRLYLKAITESALQMGKLIDDLLAFSRIGRVEMQKAEINLEQLVQEVIRDSQPESEGRAVSWEIAPLPAVRGDRSLLRQVWVNLISNALKYTRPRERAEIKLGCSADKSELVFFVRDNGVGFEMQYVNKLFGVFQRLHREDEFEGTGIGLANVRRIIQRHGGRVWAESSKGKGATFYFSLPNETMTNDG